MVRASMHASLVESLAAEGLVQAYSDPLAVRSDGCLFRELNPDWDNFNNSQKDLTTWCVYWLSGVEEWARSALWGCWWAVLNSCCARAAGTMPAPAFITLRTSTTPTGCVPTARTAQASGSVALIVVLVCLRVQVEQVCSVYFVARCPRPIAETAN